MPPRVALVNPPFLPRYSRCQRSPAVTRSGTLYYPMWLSYATGHLEQNGFEEVEPGLLRLRLNDLTPAPAHIRWAETSSAR